MLMIAKAWVLYMVTNLLGWVIDVTLINRKALKKLKGIYDTYGVISLIIYYVLASHITIASLIYRLWLEVEVQWTIYKTKRTIIKRILKNNPNNKPNG